MSVKGVARDCRRLHADLPEDLYALVESSASSPPKISVAEWTRRLIAYHLKYDLPKASERERLGIRVTGEPKRRPGRKSRNYLEHVNAPRETSE